MPAAAPQAVTPVNLVHQAALQGAGRAATAMYEGGTSLSLLPHF
jgi:hypothetical protein